MSMFDKMRTQKLLSLTLMLLTLSAGIVIGSFISTYGVKAARDNSQAQAPGATPLVIPNPVELSNAFSQIAKQVEPSVVNISTTYNPKPSQTTRNFGGRRQATPPDDEDQGGSGGMDEFLYRFFGGNPGNQEFPQMQRRGSALGSGVVVDKAGYILTNNHVVDKADRIQVKFMGDAAEYDAKVVGVDVATDLAVIRVMGKSDVVPAKVGNSDAVQVGDWAVAIGSPFGFQATVTAGIISAKERDIPGDSTQFQHFLQTDAAINPGNSGGPLLNIRGELIGINTAIASRSGGYQGIGFALPINTAAAVYNSIIKNGRMTRGSIGINFTQSDSPKAQALLKSFGAAQGVFVEKVEPGGPSEKAGLKSEDIIVSLNGKPVRDGNQLVGTVTQTPVGSTLDIGVLRDGKHQDFKVVVGDLAQIFPEQFGNGSDQDQGKEAATAATFGMEITNLTDRQRETLGIKESGGIQVRTVEPDSFAEDIGLLPNDILLSLNQHPINSTDDLQRLKATLKPGDAVAFRILRRERRNNGPWTPSYVAGTLPSR
ncbi:MAG: Do family serine endopeptidase [Bryobacteraceae bacterium]